MSEVSVYSAANVSVTYLGITLEGFGDGDDVIAVERSAPTVAKTIGIQGDGVYSQSVDKSGTIKLKMLQNCSTNKFLTAKHAASEAGVIAVGPLIITEHGSDAKVVANKATIERSAPFKRGAKQNMVEWILLSTEIIITHGEGVIV